MTLDPGLDQRAPRSITRPGFLNVASKRSSIAVSSDIEAEAENRRKDPKTSRACDICKKKKIRCDGTLPCSTCTKRKYVCTYTAKYGRGRPPTPPRSTSVLNEQLSADSESLNTSCWNKNSHPPFYTDSNGILEAQRPADIPSRASPDIENEGQYFDPTSGLNFLHRAWNKLFSQKDDTVTHGTNETDRNQLLTSAGDRLFCVNENEDPFTCIPDPSTCTTLLRFYFGTCVVTYHMFHRKTVEAWMEALLRNRTQDQPMTRSLGNPRCAILLTIMAIATLRWEKVNGTVSAENDATALRQSDQLFYTAMTLTDTERGFPRLESAQARLIQVLYLLQTSRMNKAWYTFGNTFHITLSLGMHRHRDDKRDVPFSSGRSNYITLQCCKRTFWVAYTIDRYLSVVFGRPRLYQDEDIDQRFPDNVNDEDMAPQGPLTPGDPEDCRVDALIMHAKIARIIGKASRMVYTVGEMPTHDQIATARQLRSELREWRSGLPPHLGTVKPSTLVPRFRRQAVALQLAYFHAIIHVNRPFLLGNETEDSVTECINAAKSSLELVDRMAKDNTLFHSFWWTHYVTFCSLAVVSHLMRATTGSPSQRYNIILEELRLEAQTHPPFTDAAMETHVPGVETEEHSDTHVSMFNNAERSGHSGHISAPDLSAQDNGSDTWHMVDWLTLDSSAFLPLPDPDSVSPSWLSSIQ
ncbi:hypothetical protein Plec18170_005882 [Paecilomyces lecythidis]